MINRLSSKVHQIYFKEFGSCVYLIKIGKDNILIDTSSKENGKELLRELSKLGVDLRDVHIILLTHSHQDHTGNLVGRTDFPESVPEKMQDSVNRLKSVDYEILAPGHI